MIERNAVVLFARKLGIDEYTILREYVQLRFLASLYGLTESADMYFKGGTAIHLLLRSFRFSEDLDFSTEHDKRAAKRLVGAATEVLRADIPTLSLKTISDTKTSSIFRLEFPTELSIRPLTIRIEISFREKPLSRRASVIETELPIVPYPLVVHHDFDEILAEKVRAILTRRQGRDLFDAWFLLSKKVSLNKTYIARKLAFCNRTFNMQTLRKTIEAVPVQSLKDDLEKFLPRTHRKMIADLKTVLLNALASIQ